MIKKIAKISLVLITGIFTASAAFAQTTTDTHCDATSYSSNSANINCTSISHDEVAEKAAAAEQARKDAEAQAQTIHSMSRSLGQLGQAIAARHEANIRQEQENDNAVIYVANCQKDPKLTAESNGVIMPCTVYIPKVREWCAKFKNKFNYCAGVRGVEKAAQGAPPEPSMSSLQPMTPPATPQVKPQSQQEPVSTQPGQNMIVSQPQPTNVTAVPEVSVAEAARQARIAKAIREAKEKAERDNPPPPQQ
jgi:hypothetical protein